MGLNIRKHVTATYTSRIVQDGSESRRVVSVAASARPPASSPVHRSSGNGGSSSRLGRRKTQSLLQLVLSLLQLKRGRAGLLGSHGRVASLLLQPDNVRPDPKEIAIKINK
jgi:hypothetical protein